MSDKILVSNEILGRKFKYVRELSESQKTCVERIFDYIRKYGYKVHEIYSYAGSYVLIIDSWQGKKYKYLTFEENSLEKIEQKIKAQFEQ